MSPGRLAGRLLAALAAVAVPLLPAGCGDDAPSAAAGPEALEGIPWVLASGVDLPDGAPAPSAAFADGGVSGSTGCNRYRGTYRLDGSALRIEGIAMTQMACPPPADAVEREFVGALERVTGWRAEGDEGVALLADGSAPLVFRAATPVGSWEATMLVRGDALTSPLAGTTVTATFGADGTLSGSAGCNRYTATWSADGDRLAIAPPASTRRACPEPHGVMAQEAAYLAGLEQAARFSVDDGALSLLRADGTAVARFAPR